MDVYEEIYIFLAFLSALFSLMVVLTGLIWPGIMLSKSKPFSTIVFFISFADFCGSILNCLGFPSNGSDMCSLQACGSLYFAPASWLWSMVLVYQLRTLIIFKSINLSMKWLHFICWSIPLIPTFLPLTTNPYGQDDSLNGSAPCVLGGNSTTKFIWLNTTKSGLAFLCFFFMIIWTIEIHLYLTAGADLTREKSLFYTMILYPTVLFITGIPNFIVVTLIDAKVLATDSLFTYLCFVFASQYGFLVAIVYFSRSSVSRLLWYNLLKRICLSVLFVFGCSLATISCSSVMDEDEKLIHEDSIVSDENLLVTQAIFRDSSRLRDSLLELRDSSVTNIII